MKRIGIDARLLFQTGVGTYLQNMLHYLPIIAPQDITFVIYCLPSGVTFIEKEFPRATIRITSALWHSLQEQTDFLTLVTHDTLDLMHFTYFGHPVLYRTPYVSTVHDVTPLLFKTGRASTKNPLTYFFKQAAFSYVLRNQVEQSRAIITPTQVVKEQLVHLYGEKVGKKVTPLYEGISYRLASIKNDEERIIKKPYLLYVGNFYPHKNVEFLIHACAKKSVPYTLVLAGPHDYFLKRILSGLSDEEKKNIILKDKQTLGELANLYTYAEALIHPSTSEGFGLPIVEAMHFKLPIIASHIPVFQELLGTSYYSFDPFEQTSILQAIDSFAHDKNKKKNVLRAEFSFENMTRKTMDLYLKHV